jgi:glutamate 5-kinase
MKTIVVKVGSSIIAPCGKIEIPLISALIQDIWEAEKLGYKVVLVSSGAIACGANKLGIKKKPSDKASLMALASLGQIILMDAYAKSLSGHKQACAQILLTRDDFDKRSRFLNGRNTINKLLEFNVLPIINENDAVSDDEIKFGDNDRLSALVADMACADILLILSDVEGLLDEGKLVPLVEKVDAKIFDLVKTKKSGLTSGGMHTKLQAAQTAAASGIKMVIASGREKKVISRVCAKEHIGTIFLPGARGVK